MNQQNSLSPSAREAARLLGLQVRHGRRERRWTLIDLAARVGVSEVTLRKVEKGDVTVALGTAFEAAALVGVTLFDDDELRRHLHADRLVLLNRIRTPRPTIDNDF